MLIADVNGGAGIYGFTYVGKRRARDEVNAANGTDTYKPVLTIGTSAGAIASFADACGATTAQLEAVMPVIRWADADPTRGFLKRLSVVSRKITFNHVDLGQAVAFGWDLLRDGFLKTEVLTEKIRTLGEGFGVRTFRELEAKHAAGAPEFHCFAFDTSTRSGFIVPDDITDHLGIPREATTDDAGNVVPGWLDMDVADFVAASACATPGFKPTFIKDAAGNRHKFTDGGAWASLPMEAAEDIVDDWVRRHPGSERPLVIGATPFGLSGGYHAPRTGAFFKLFPGLGTIIDLVSTGNATENEYAKRPEVRGRIAVFNTRDIGQDPLDLMVSLKTQGLLEADGYEGFRSWDAGRRAAGLPPYSGPQIAAPGGPSDRFVA